MIYRILIIFLSYLLLSGCSLFPAKIEPTKSYVIDSLPPATVKRSRHAIVLLVMPTETNAIYNTTQMAYTTRPYQVAYFTKNQWADLPSRMLQKLLVESLQNTHYYRAVVTPPFVGHYDYILNTQLLELQQNFMYGPTLNLVMSAQLVRVSSGNVVGSKEFRVIEPMPECTPYGGVLAANRAASKLLGQVTRYIVEVSARS